MSETITLRAGSPTKNKAKFEGRSSEGDFTVYTPKGTEMSKVESFTITIDSPSGE